VSAIVRPAAAPSAVLPDSGFLGPLGGAPPGGFPFPPFFCTPIDASAYVIAASLIFISCIPAADPLDEDARAAALSLLGMCVFDTIPCLPPLLY
jgi:hypothetical protein